MRVLILDSDVVTNVVNAHSIDEAEAAHPSSTCMEGSELPGAPGIGWTLADVEAWTPPDDSAAIFAARKAEKIESLSVGCRTFIHSRYPDHVQSSLSFLLSEGMASGYTNRITMIQGAMAWAFSVITEYYARRSALQAATDQTALDDVSLDFESFSASDPGLLLETVMATLD